MAEINEVSESSTRLLRHEAVNLRWTASNLARSARHLLVATSNPEIYELLRDNVEDTLHKSILVLADTVVPITSSLIMKLTALLALAKTHGIETESIFILTARDKSWAYIYPALQPSSLPSNTTAISTTVSIPLTTLLASQFYSSTAFLCEIIHIQRGLSRVGDGVFTCLTSRERRRYNTRSKLRDRGELIGLVKGDLGRVQEMGRRLYADANGDVHRDGMLGWMMMELNKVLVDVLQEEAGDGNRGERLDDLVGRINSVEKHWVEWEASFV